MKWHKFDNTNFPSGEVLAINDLNEMLVGHLSNNGFCHSDEEVLTRVTHYIYAVDLIELKIQND